MKICFLCPSLEPGQDGVGDYTLRLARQLQELGHECLCIAINDNKLGEDSSANREAEISGTGALVLRFSGRKPWEERIPLLREAVRRFGPDWISLQYVPWGYDPKGLPRQLAGRLSAVINQHPLQIMCHELWMEGPWFSIKNRLLGALQKPLCREIFSVLHPKVVHTHIPLYREMLRRIAVDIEILPLHGNIPVAGTRDEARAWLKEKTAIEGDAFVAGFFGNLWQTFNLDMLKRLATERDQVGRGMCIVSAGTLSPSGESKWKAIEAELNERSAVYRLGSLVSRDVSHYLGSLDLGLTTYPKLLAGKSGSVAAMLEHGVAVRTLGRLPHRAESSDLISPRQGATVAETAGRFMVALESAALR